MKTAEPMAIRTTKANRNIPAIIATPSSRLRQFSNIRRDPLCAPREKHDLDQRRGAVVMNDYHRVRVGREARGINSIGEKQWQDSMI